MTRDCHATGRVGIPYCGLKKTVARTGAGIVSPGLAVPAFSRILRVFGDCLTGPSAAHSIVRRLVRSARPPVV